MQKRDLEILAHTCEICSLKDRYSSIRTPNSLKLVSAPSLEILSIGIIKVGSSGWPGTLLLNTRLHSALLMFFPWVRKIIYLVFEVFTAILLALNHRAHVG